MKNRRGGALVAVLVGVLAAAVIGLIVMIGFGVHFARSVHVTKSSDKTVVETPVGTVTLRDRRDSHARLPDMPVYPGAVAVEGDSRKLASIELDIGDTYKEFSIVSAEYTTTDDVSRVVAFYRSKLPSSWIIREKSHRWEMKFEKGGHKRIVAVKEQGGLTHITLASVGEPASN